MFYVALCFQTISSSLIWNKGVPRLLLLEDFRRALLPTLYFFTLLAISILRVAENLVNFARAHVSAAK